MSSSAAAVASASDAPSLLVDNAHHVGDFAISLVACRAVDRPPRLDVLERGWLLVEAGLARLRRADETHDLGRRFDVDRDDAELAAHRRLDGQRPGHEID